jgi:hypothetical protein
MKVSTCSTRTTSTASSSRTNMCSSSSVSTNHRAASVASGSSVRLLRIRYRVQPLGQLNGKGRRDSIATCMLLSVTVQG